jgi:thiol-disulfide isomerase/thioredoxin
MADSEDLGCLAQVIGYAVLAIIVFGAIKIGGNLIEKYEKSTPKYKVEQKRKEQYQAQMSIVGEKAPNIKGTDTNGNKFDLNSYKGQAVLLNFGATWCRYSDDAFKKMENALTDVKSMVKQEKSIYGDYDYNKYAIISVIPDRRSRESNVKASMSNYHFTVVPGNDQNIIDYKVAGYPTSFLIGADGRIYSKVNKLENIERLLSKCWRDTYEVSHTFKYTLSHENGLTPETRIYICKNKSYKSFIYRKLLYKRMHLRGVNNKDRGKTGTFTYTWDGKFKNRSGSILKAEPGVYYYYIKSGDKKSDLKKFELKVVK